MSKEFPLSPTFSHTMKSWGDLKHYPNRLAGPAASVVRQTWPTQGLELEFVIRRAVNDTLGGSLRMVITNTKAITNNSELVLRLSTNISNAGRKMSVNQGLWHSHHRYTNYTYDEIGGNHHPVGPTSTMPLPRIRVV